MFKVISAEIKKMLSKPGVYVLSVLLALILVLGVFIYKPTIAQSSYISLNGSTVLEKYTNYYSNNNGVESGIKIQVKDDVDATVNMIEAYKYHSTSYKSAIQSQMADVEAKFDNYRDYGVLTNASQTSINNARNALISSINALNTTILTGINLNPQMSYPIVTTKSNYQTYTAAYDSSLDLLSISSNNISAQCSEFEAECLPKLKTAINEFAYPTLSNEFIKSYTSTESTSKFSVIKSRLTQLENEIEQFKNSAGTNADFNLSNADKFEKLVNVYVSTCATYTNLVKYELICIAFECTTTTQQLQLLYLDKYSPYNCQSSLIRYDYLFNNNKTEFDYANPLTIGTTANAEINGYDYAYFSMRLFSFVLIAYAIMSACSSIAGEVKEGSMRYFAIRPVGRTKMLFGKYFAIMLMSFILSVFSSVIAIIVGNVVYGINSLSILTIFNGTTAIVLHPAVMFVIYVASMLLEIAIYTSIALLFSCLFKSDLFAVTILLMLYLVNFMLPLFVGGVNSWLTFYPFSHISLYALFGSSIYAQQGNIFSNLLGAKVFTGTNAILTVCVILILLILPKLFATFAFKKKEL